MRLDWVWWSRSEKTNGSFAIFRLPLLGRFFRFCDSCKLACWLLLPDQSGGKWESIVRAQWSSEVEMWAACSPSVSEKSPGKRVTGGQGAKEKKKSRSQPKSKIRNKRTFNTSSPRISHLFHAIPLTREQQKCETAIFGNCGMRRLVSD
jgi:hypothetical protein